MAAFGRSKCHKDFRRVHIVWGYSRAHFARLLSSNYLPCGPNATSRVGRHHFNSVEFTSTCKFVLYDSTVSRVQCRCLMHVEHSDALIVLKSAICAPQRTPIYFSAGCVAHKQRAQRKTKNIPNCFASHTNFQSAKHFWGLDGTRHAGDLRSAFVCVCVCLNDWMICQKQKNINKNPTASSYTYFGCQNMLARICHIRDDDTRRQKSSFLSSSPHSIASTLHVLDEKLPYSNFCVWRSLTAMPAYASFHVQRVCSRIQHSITNYNFTCAKNFWRLSEKPTTEVICDGTCSSQPFSSSHPDSHTQNGDSCWEICFAGCG